MNGGMLYDHSMLWPALSPLAERRQVILYDQRGRGSVVGAGATRATRRSKTTRPTSARSGERSAFVGGTCSATRGAAASRCSPPPLIPAACDDSCSSIRCGPRAIGWRRYDKPCSRDCRPKSAMPSRGFPKNRLAIPTLCSTAHTAAPSIRRGSPTSTWQIVLHLRTRRAKRVPRCSHDCVATATTGRDRLRSLSTPTIVIHGERGSSASSEVRGRFLYTQRPNRRSSRLGAHALLGSARTLLLIDRILPVSRLPPPLFPPPLPARSGHPVQNEASCILPTVPCPRDGSPRFGACAKTFGPGCDSIASQSERRPSTAAKHGTRASSAEQSAKSWRRSRRRRRARRRTRGCTPAFFATVRPAPTLTIF